MKVEKQYKKIPCKTLESKSGNSNFSDNRSTFVRQAMMISSIHDYGNANIGVQGNLTQLKAMAGDKNLFYEEQLSLPPKPREQVIEANEQEKEILNDPFKRYYNDKDEFRDHVAGEKVACGLIKKLARWYRMDELMGRKMFVLGEAHNLVGHHTIVEESNQKEKLVLTEGGALNIGLKGDNVKWTDSGVTYESMESILSKTLFGLIALKKSKKMEEETSEEKKEVDAPDWFKSIPSIRPVHREELLSTRFGVPYYYSSMFSYEKNYLKVKREEDKRTAGGDFGRNHYTQYDLFETAKRVVNSCIQSIDNHMTDSHDENSFNSGLVLLRSCLQEVIPTDASAIVETKLDDAIFQCKDIAIEEQRVLGDLAFRRPKYNEDESLTPAKNVIEESMHNANSLREAFMFKAISEAYDKDKYLLAGIGDAHARSMKDELLKKGIKTITLSEFTKDKCKNAF